MPLRNALILFCSAVLSLICYLRADRNHYTPTFAFAFNEVNAKYVEEVDPRVLYEGAMRGMLEKLDSNSAYTSPDDYRKVRERIDQEFGGIGILVEMNEEKKRLGVRAPLYGTPAYRAGMKPGDTVLSIDEHDTLGLTLEGAVELMRGPIGSKLTLTVEREGAAEPLTFELQRERIPIESVFGESRLADGRWDFHLAEDRRIGLIRINEFGARTSEEFSLALKSLLEPGKEIQGLVVDLRTNPGGLLDEAVKICDFFLESGVIVSTRGRHGVLKSEYTANAGVLIPPDVPLVVLVDQRSASASEIVASCLQDHQRAVICGQRTWGKGTVQNIIELEPRKSAMRLTTATYWRPSEKNIHKMKNATEGDDWGVRPSDGFDAPVADELFEKIMRQRREKDLKIHAVEETPSDKSPEQPPPQPIPTDDAIPPSSDNSKTPSNEPVVDPPLLRAVEYLRGKMVASSEQ